MPRLDLQVALGVGVGGALVDVSTYARLTDGLTCFRGRTDAFYGTEAGTFEFVLDNPDGRFTPENASSPLDTPLVEGMAACVSVGGRLTAGTVRSIGLEFPSDDSALSVVRVVCDDLLGDASRERFGRSFTESLAVVLADYYWPFDQPRGASAALEQSGNLGPAWNVSGVTFGQTNPGVGLERVALFSALAGQTFTSYPSSPIILSGWINMWITPLTSTGFLEFRGSSDQLLFRVDGSNFVACNLATFPFEVGRTYFISSSGGTQLWVDGVLVVSDGPQFVLPAFVLPRIIVGTAAGASSFLISEYSVSPSRVPFQPLAGSTVADQLGILETLSPNLNYGTPSTDLSPSFVGPFVKADSVLDALGELEQAEQGYLYTETTGTLTSPTATIHLQPRLRPETASVEFSATDEGVGSPVFTRAVGRLVSRVSVSSADDTTVVFDAQLATRAGQSSDLADIPLYRDLDRRAWGEDRLLRGANTRFQISSVVVDAMTTPTDRSADLLGLQFGDRVRLTDLPSDVLGFDSWDGWYIGAREVHNLEKHAFELFFTPVLPDTAVYDTDRYMASGELLLDGAINSSVTSISVESSGALLSTTETPYTIQFDDEQMTVTAVSGASSPQTVTVTRGVNGTTAASHSDGAVLVSVPDSLYAF